MRDNPNPSEALKELARVPLNDAESGCHAIFRKYNLTVSVNVEYENVGSGELSRLPMVPFSTWVRYLLDNNKLDAICGLQEDALGPTLREFWSRFQALHPTHELFSLAERGEVDLSCCVPVYSHMDEGRTYKSKAFMIVSVHGALGQGTRSYVRRRGVRPIHVKKDPMKMNFIGNTWGSQFMIFSLTRQASVDNPNAFDRLMTQFAADMAFLARRGISSSNGARRIWIQHLGLKGDLPALAKVGHLERCFTRMPKFANTRKRCVGICWLCLAGQESEDGNVPFEDMRPNAKWSATLMQEAPWREPPPILSDLPWVPGEEASFLKTDFWHNWHNGLGKIWVACSFVMMATMGVLVGNSVDAKFEVLTQEYLAWGRREGITPYIRVLNRDTFSFQSNNSSPLGSWSKAAVTTHMMLFLSAFCLAHVEGQTEDPLLKAIVSWHCSLLNFKLSRKSILNISVLFHVIAR